MKTLISLFVALLAMSAHADYRSIRLTGEDAEFIIHAFRDISSAHSVSDPITSNPLLDSLSYQSSAVTVDCRVKYRLYENEPRCNVSLSSASVEVTDRAFVTALRSKIQTEFVSKARAADTTTPLLRINCSATACTLQAAN